MRILIGVCLCTFLLPIILVVALANGDEGPASGCWGADIDAILRTIRTVESGGDYTAHARGSSASGAYQFTDATWNKYGGYRRAVDAPPAVQDAKAAEHASQILQTHGLELIPVIWYIGHVPSADEWDQVPFAAAGNTLTPRQYQQKWLSSYRAPERAHDPPRGAWCEPSPREP